VGLPRLQPVYMPTDTTQLGYYYQHVPYWLPRPNAVPPAPRPADWHVSMCQLETHGHPAGVIIGTAPTAITAPVYGVPMVESGSEVNNGSNNGNNGNLPVAPTPPDLSPTP